MPTYPGGKNGPGTFQRIINQIPPVEMIVSPFLGYCGLLNHIRPPHALIGLDLDPSVVARWRRRSWPDTTVAEFRNADALEFLASEAALAGVITRRLYYLDPPYHFDTRRGGARRLYRHELRHEDHERLAKLARNLPGFVILNHPPHPVYEAALADWRKIDHHTPSRGGLIPDRLWLNYPQPTRLHDTRYAGDNKRQRERIRRRCRNWTAALRRAGPIERQAILEAIAAAFPAQGLS